MKWYVKGGLIGGALGGGIASYQASQRSPEEVASGDATGMLVLRGAATGALAGTSVAWVFKVKADRKARKTAQKLADQSAAKGRQLANKARPHLDQARDTVSSQWHDASHLMATSVVPAVVAAAEKAADTVGGVVHDAVEAGRPAMTEALQSGRGALVDAYEAGRPGATQALSASRAGLTDAAHGARPGVDAIVDSGRDRVSDLVDVSRDRAESAVETGRERVNARVA